METLTLSTVFRRRVKRWMEAERISQRALARTLGVTQPNVSKRLLGKTDWTLDDIEALKAEGCPVDVVFTDGFDLEEVGSVSQAILCCGERWDSGERALLSRLLEGQTVQSVTLEAENGDYIEIVTSAGTLRIEYRSCCCGELWIEGA